MVGWHKQINLSPARKIITQCKRNGWGQKISASTLLVRFLQLLPSLRQMQASSQFRGHSTCINTLYKMAKQQALPVRQQKGKTMLQEAFELLCSFSIEEMHR